MKTTTPLLLFATFAVGAVAVIGACTPKPQGLFAETSPQVVSPAQGDSAHPHFIGRWAVGVGRCDSPMIIQAKALSDGVTNCDFAKVDGSTAGYTISAMCRAGAVNTPSRLNLILPDPQQAGSMTLSGGPFKMPVALERCAAQN
jgi:hypothetical protein